MLGVVRQLGPTAKERNNHAHSLIECRIRNIRVMSVFATVALYVQLVPKRFRNAAILKSRFCYAFLKQCQNSQGYLISLRM